MEKEKQYLIGHDGSKFEIPEGALMEAKQRSWLGRKIDNIKEWMWIIFKGRFVLNKSIIHELDTKEGDIISQSVTNYYLKISNEGMSWTTNPYQAQVFTYLDGYIWVKALNKREGLKNIEYSLTTYQDAYFMADVFNPEK